MPHTLEPKAKGEDLIRNLKSMLPQELATWLEASGYPKYRAKQIFGWIHKAGVTSTEEMSNLPRELRSFLVEHSFLTTGSVETRQNSEDGSSKLLIAWPDGQAVETVLLPQRERLAICLSTQVGCAMGCAFCATGKGGYRRQLTSSEIVEQVRLAENIAGRAATNLVYMGMGEPLANFDHTIRSIELLNHPLGRNLGMRHITISTCGLVPQIEKLGELGWQVVLAISLHAARDELRSELMPINKKYPLSKLIPTCQRYAKDTSRRVTFEYALIEGINDGEGDARALGNLLRGWLCHLNLIPLNQVPGLPYRPCSQSEIRVFANKIERMGIPVTVRASMGQDVAAACGQLRGGRYLG